MAIYQYPNDFVGTQWSIHDGNIYVSNTSTNIPDGSPLNPYKTIQDAIENGSNADKIVIGTGLFNENIIIQPDEFRNIVADGIVIFDGKNLINEFLKKFGNGTKIEGLQIKNYNYVILNNISASNLIINNCKISNCIQLNIRGLLVNTLVINTDVIAEKIATIMNCTFLISSFGNLILNKFKIIRNCIFGKDCILKINSVYTDIFDYCNFEPGSIIRIDTKAYSKPQNVNVDFSQYLENSFNVIPGFNNVAMEDFSLSEQSPLLNVGYGGKQIGAFCSGKSFHNSINHKNSSFLDNATLINVSVTENGNYVITRPHSIGQIETEIIDLGRATTPGKISVFSEQTFETPPNNSVVDSDYSQRNPNILTYEMRFSDIQEELNENQIPYKEFAWNRQPMIDKNGNGNGSENFDSSSAIPITAQYFQVRITLRDNTNFLLNEDGSYILQEEGYKIIIEF